MATVCTSPSNFQRHLLNRRKSSSESRPFMIVNWALLGLLFASRIPRKPWACWLTRRYPSGWESTTYLGEVHKVQRNCSLRGTTHGVCPRSVVSILRARRRVAAMTAAASTVRHASRGSSPCVRGGRAGQDFGINLPWSISPS